jgi:transposase
MSRPIGTPAELQRRRRRAVDLVAQGEARATVARILGVTRLTLARWLRLAGEPQGLAAKRHPGPTPALSDEQLTQLETLLLQGAHRHGWHNQRWTAARVAQMIERHFHVHYHPEHVRKILKWRLGWTSQKPKRKARERNLKEVERWRDDEFPRIVREAFRRRATLVFLDESGFQLTPTVRRSLAPRGRTPIVHAWDRRDKISAISCLTVSPIAGRTNLYFDLRNDDGKLIPATLV